MWVASQNPFVRTHLYTWLVSRVQLRRPVLVLLETDCAFFHETCETLRPRYFVLGKGLHDLGICSPAEQVLSGAGNARGLCLGRTISGFNIEMRFILCCDLLVLSRE